MLTSDVTIHMMGRPVRRSVALGAASIWALCCASVAVGNINIELRPPITAVAPNAIVNVGLYLVSDNATTQYSISAEIVFGWNNTRLQFLGIDNTGGAPVTSSVLPSNSPLNEVLPPQDGNGFYLMLGQFGSPLPATPAGTLLTTFRFRALSTACTGAAFTILPSGGTPVQFTNVADGFTPGLLVTGTLGSATVFIDGAPPVINTCAPPQVVPVGPTCQGVMPNMTGLVSVADNCSNLTITQTPLAGAVLGMGVHAVVIQVKDPGGNIVTCPTSVTVADQTGPVINQCAPPPPAIAANGNCQGAIPNLTGGVIATDACSPPVTVTQSPTVGTLVGLGTHTVTLTAKDAQNNPSTCQVDVTVTDQTGPQISQCAAPQTLPADANCQAAIPDLTGGVIATDACSGPVTVTQSPTAGTLVGLGPHNVTLTATDAVSNTSNCQAVVTVTDQTAPDISQCAPPQTIPANVSCQAAIPDLTGLVIATDACSPPVTFTQSPPAGTVVGLGPHTVTLTAKDAANNESTCQAVVTVADQTAAAISQCASAQTVAADANRQAQIPDLTGLVIATDACSPPVVVTQSPLAGTVVGLGPHTVTFTATDAANNTSNCQAVVTVADQTDPVISQCAPSPTVAADANCQAAIPDLTDLVIATDACSPPVVITQSPVAGTLVGLGPHTVTMTATDAVNNSSTCDAIVTVEDQTVPNIAQCAAPQSLPADANCQAAIPDLTGQVIATDACSPPVTVTQSPTAGTLVGPGPHTVTLTAKDAANNESTCQAVITVADQTAPQISVCPSPPAIAANGLCQATVPDLTGGVVASDNCTPTPGLVISQLPIAGATIGLGPTQVTISVQDAALNVATCLATVTVTDQTPPTLVGCPTNMTVNTNAGSCAAVVSWAVPTATDNCGGATVTRTQGPAPGSTFAGGSTTTIEYTATDGASLTSVCSFTVTVTPSPDMDNDGDVDVDDLPIFVNVLLGVDTTPLRVARADVNCDGAVNGRDIQPFTDILTP